MGTAERTPKEGFLSGDADGRRAEDREKRNQEAGQQARFAGMDLLQGHCAGDGTDAGDLEDIAILRDDGAEAPGCRQGRFAVPARGIAGKRGSSFREGGSENGPLGKAFGGGHPETMAFHRTPGAIHRLPERRRRPLPGSGGIVFAEGCVGKGRTLPKGLQPGSAPRFAHAERHEGALGAFIIKGHHPCHIVGTIRPGHNLDHFAAETPAAVQRG